MAYFSGQGKVLIGKATDGKVGALRYVGNCPALQVELSTETTEHKESHSGQRLTDMRLVTSKMANITVTLEDFTQQNLALGLYGTAAQTAGASVTDEALPAGLKAGDLVRLAHPGVSAVSVKNKANTALVAGPDYEVHSTNHGSLKILKDIAATTQPLKASYTHRAYANVTMFDAASADNWVRFEGLNAADSNNPVLIELYRVSFDPLANLGAISDELLQMELKGSALYDSTKVGDARLGQFGRVVML